MAPLAGLFDRATTRQKLLLLGILLLLVNMGFFFYLYQPKAGAMAAASAEVAQLRQRVRDKAGLAEGVARLRQEKAELERQLALLVERLPEEKEIPRLLRQVAIIARQSGLEVLLFKQKESQDRILYREISVELGVLGGYQNLWGFLNQVSQLPRLMNVREVLAKGIETPRAGSTLRADMTMVVFQSPASFSGVQEKGQPGGQQ